ncbi:NADH-quinone oxidoreductase subunit E [Rhodopseudomonas julia]|uniref:NADH-quinone oxidoreductase subunit E n=1 Tax=Rhodopseudomonas julia TaxID=200617 RepID=A0ABU0CAY3_9BRAD|nr:NADH-quinone oxidoreductase subunit NuoE [Rhodopseudomonas julia]MDQ0327338.1 NADH-quinone oxidoreductase subunit E [Rhodopseudomonas julia]
MAVRRLAEQQPDSFAFTPENTAWAEREITKYPEGRQASAVISLLWRAQEQEGWVTKPAIETIAHMLSMPEIRVLEVATFYTMFHLAPVGTKAHVQVCGTTPCMLRGSDELKKVCQRRIAEHPHEVSADGAFSWEEVECLGACVNAPMVQIFSDTYEDLTPESFEAILDDFAAGRTPHPGTQIDRQHSAPQSGLTSLTEIDGGSEQVLREPPRGVPAEGEAHERVEGRNGASVGAGKPTPANEDLAGGAPEEPQQAVGRNEAAATPSGKQELAGRPTGSGRPDEEAARSEPTDTGSENLGAEPHKATIHEQAERGAGREPEKASRDTSGGTDNK